MSRRPASFAHRLPTTALYTPILALLLACSGTLALALPPQLPKGPERGSDADASQDQDKGNKDGDAKEKEGKSKIKPYEEVITDKAVTREGVFLTHQVGDKLFYEIPNAELDRQFLLVSRISKTAAGLGAGGEKLSSRIVRWQRHDERVFLREVSYDLVADASQPIARAVAAANNDPILMGFDIVAFGENDSAVIEVTPLFATEIDELSAKQRIGARGFDKSRSYVDHVAAFPNNIEVRAVHTYTAPPEPPDRDRSPEPPSRRPRMRQNSATLELAFSMVRLPEKPMMPRLFDERVGYFSISQTDYGVDEHRAPERRYITRWRLEKKDPQAEISEPVKAIVYWIDPATPKQWVPYIEQGVEAWQPAFEAAGFRNAIVAREAPSPEEDPEWSPEDSRYSVIRWLPSEIENAQGPHVHDPRTGEILESDIQVYHNVQNLVRDWYFVQVGPLDPRAQSLPLPDDLMGELLRYVVAHEVGHTLGFQHNMKASSTYPFDKLRDPEWLATMGHTPTLMDYSRFNYLVQPGDGVAVGDLIPKIGPYDKWATRWGYQPIPGAKSPEDERATLDDWARAQDTTPWLRFSTDGARGSDPGELTEAVGDANAVAATGLGLANLERVVDLLLPATDQPGRNWDDLEELYDRVVGQWIREMNHVAAIVGGNRSREVHHGQVGVRFEPVARATQEKAVRFLNEQAFTTPSFLVRSDILQRIEPQGIGGRLAAAQRSVLELLLRPDRFTRLAEQHAIEPDVTYPPVAFLDDLRLGIWSELDARQIAVATFRRQTQRLYLDVVDQLLNSGGAATDDYRAFLRGELRELRNTIRHVQSRAQGDATRFHLADALHEIDDILEPKLPRATPNRDRAFAFRDQSEAGIDPFDPTVEHGCWSDPVPFLVGADPGWR